MSTDGYQGVSPAQSLVAVQIGRHYVTTAGLAFNLLSFADPEAWAAATEYSDQHRMPAAPPQDPAAVLAREDFAAAVRRALREALVGACRSLQGDPRAYRVLHRSFLAPAPSLEAAAEALGMPSSTFRRHLTSAVDRVVELLWGRSSGVN